MSNLPQTAGTLLGTVITLKLANTVGKEALKLNKRKRKQKRRKK